MNFRQIKAIENANKQRILKMCPFASDVTGIYILTREENGFKFCYVGQAKKILTRLAQHLTGYQHIDLSIKKHGLYNKENNKGWKISRLIKCDNLDDAEKQYILEYHKLGYQLRNKTVGGQCDGKFSIAENKSTKGYRDGLNQGYNNARKEITHLFELHLDYSIKGKQNKNKEKAIEKFKKFLKND